MAIGVHFGFGFGFFFYCLLLHKACIYMRLSLLVWQATCISTACAVPLFGLDVFKCRCFRCSKFNTTTSAPDFPPFLSLPPVSSMPKQVYASSFFFPRQALASPMMYLLLRANRLTPSPLAINRCSETYVLNPT